MSDLLRSQWLDPVTALGGSSGASSPSQSPESPQPRPADALLRPAPAFPAYGAAEGTAPDEPGWAAEGAVLQQPSPARGRTCGAGCSAVFQAALPFAVAAASLRPGWLAACDAGAVIACAAAARGRRSWTRPAAAAAAVIPAATLVLRVAIAAAPSLRGPAAVLPLGWGGCGGPEAGPAAAVLAAAPEAAAGAALLLFALGCGEGDKEKPRVGSGRCFSPLEGGGGPFPPFESIGGGWAWRGQAGAARALLRRGLLVAGPALAAAALPSAATLPLLLLAARRLWCMFNADAAAGEPAAVGWLLRAYAAALCLAQLLVAAAGSAGPDCTVLQWCQTPWAPRWAAGAPWCGNPGAVAAAVWSFAVACCAVGSADPAELPPLPRPQVISLGAAAHFALWASAIYALRWPGWAGLALLVVALLAANTNTCFSSAGLASRSTWIQHALLALLLLSCGGAAAEWFAAAVLAPPGAAPHNEFLLQGAALTACALAAAAAGHVLTLRCTADQGDDDSFVLVSTVLNALPRGTAKMATLLLVITGSAGYADGAHLLLLVCAAALFYCASDDPVRKWWKAFLYAIETVAVFEYVLRHLGAGVWLRAEPTAGGWQWGALDCFLWLFNVQGKDPGSLLYLVLCVSLCLVQGQRFEDGEWWSVPQGRDARLRPSGAACVGFSCICVLLAAVAARATVLTLIALGVLARTVWSLSGIGGKERRAAVRCAMRTSALAAALTYLSDLPAPVGPAVESWLSVGSRAVFLEAALGVGGWRVSASLLAWLASALSLCFLLTRFDLEITHRVAVRREALAPGGGVAFEEEPPLHGAGAATAVLRVVRGGGGLREGMRVLRCDGAVVCSSARVQDIVSSGGGASARRGRAELEVLMPPRYAWLPVALAAQAPAVLLAASLFGGGVACNPSQCFFYDESLAGWAYFALGCCYAPARARRLFSAPHNGASSAPASVQLAPLEALPVLPDATPPYVCWSALLGVALAALTVLLSLPASRRFLVGSFGPPAAEWVAVAGACWHGEGAAAATAVCRRQLPAHLAVLLCSCVERRASQWAARFHDDHRRSAAAASRWGVLLLLALSSALLFNSVWGLVAMAALVAAARRCVHSVGLHRAATACGMLLYLYAVLLPPPGLRPPWGPWLDGAVGAIDIAGLAGGYWDMLPGRTVLALIYLAAQLAAVGAAVAPGGAEGAAPAAGLGSRLAQCGAEVDEARASHAHAASHAASKRRLQQLLLQPRHRPWFLLVTSTDPDVAAAFGGYYALREGGGPVWAAEGGCVITPGEGDDLGTAPWELRPSQGADASYRSMSTGAAPHAAGPWRAADGARGEVTVDAPLVPRRLCVAGLGCLPLLYSLERGLLRGGMPVWRRHGRARGGGAFLLSSKEGHWVTADAAGRPVERPALGPAGGVISEHAHRGAMPHRAAEWRPLGRGGAGTRAAVLDAAAVAQLHVASAEAPHTGGWYTLVAGELREGRPVWRRGGGGQPASEVRAEGGRWVVAGEAGAVLSCPVDTGSPLPGAGLQWVLLDGGSAPGTQVRCELPVPYLPGCGPRGDGAPAAAAGMQLRLTPPGFERADKCRAIVDALGTDERTGEPYALVTVGGGVGQLRIGALHWAQEAFAAPDPSQPQQGRSCVPCSRRPPVYVPDSLLLVGTGSALDGFYERERPSQWEVGGLPVWRMVGTGGISSAELTTGAEVLLNESAVGPSTAQGKCQGVVEGVTESEVLLLLRDSGLPARVRRAAWDAPSGAAPSPVFHMVSTAGGHWCVTGAVSLFEGPAQLSSVGPHRGLPPDAVRLWEPQPNTAPDPAIAVYDAGDPRRTRALRPLLLAPHLVLLLTLWHGAYTPSHVSLASLLITAAALGYFHCLEDMLWLGNLHWRWLYRFYAALLILWLVMQIPQLTALCSAGFAGQPLRALGACLAPGDGVFRAAAPVVLAALWSLGQLFDSGLWAWFLVYKHKLHCAATVAGRDITMRRGRSVRRAHAEFDRKREHRLQALEQLRRKREDLQQIWRNFLSSAQVCRHRPHTPGARPARAPHTDVPPAQAAALAAAAGAAAVAGIAAAEAQHDPTPAERLCVELLRRTYKPMDLAHVRAFAARRGRLVLALRVAYRSLFSWSAELAYALAALHFLDSPCVATLVPLSSVVLYALCSNPRPLFAYWTCGLWYYGGLAALKGLLLWAGDLAPQWDLSLLLGWSVWQLGPAARGPRVTLMGFAMWELLLFVAVSTHRHALRFLWGLSGDGELTRAAEQTSDVEGLGDPEPAGVPRIAGKACTAARAFLSAYRRNLFNHRLKRGGQDLYAPIFTTELAAFVFLVFGYAPMMGSRVGFIQSVSANLVPGGLVVAVSMLFLLMIAERVVYLARSVRVKAAFHCAMSALYLLVYLWWSQSPERSPPATPGAVDSRVSPPFLPAVLPIGRPGVIVQIFCGLKVLYLALSAVQLREGYGFAERRTFFAGRYTLFWWYVYQVYYAVPFLYELRNVVDWAFTHTSLKLVYWLRLEDVMHETHLALCQKEDDRVTPPGPYPAWSKCSSFATYCGLMTLLILFPLAWYSSLSPAFANSDIIKASLDISLVAGDVSYGLYHGNFAVAQAMEPGFDANNLSLALPARSWGRALELTRPSLLGLGLVSGPTRTLQQVPFPEQSIRAWGLNEGGLASLAAAVAAGGALLQWHFALTRTNTAPGLGQVSASQALALAQPELEQLGRQLGNITQPLSPGAAAPAPISLRQAYTPIVFAGSVLDFYAPPPQDPAETNAVACNLTVAPRAPGAPVDATYWNLTCATVFADGNPPSSALEPGNDSFAQPERDCLGAAADAQALACGGLRYDRNTSAPHWAAAAGPYLTVLSDRVASASGMWSMIPSVGVVALYTTFVFAVHRALRSAFTGEAHRIPVRAMESPEAVEEVISFIHDARLEGDLELERGLYEEVINLLRSPEAMREWIRTRAAAAPAQDPTVWQTPPTVAASGWLDSGAAEPCLPP
eukprot:TRINITY_DN42533_c1_g1_i1.p1 TRINITY_DN42533_c1_g1~~TRINITY_DN42533_c1_g1_i1.p1  ORF type:complete len:2993 (+),score=812.61 TRINITY_DN42533_c1_g1_i1:72-8981(+)